jgi:tRNA A37 threonylcarbamoyladenosine synthetase subunit TsaC/SUA5/YrdC
MTPFWPSGRPISGSHLQRQGRQGRLLDTLIRVASYRLVMAVPTVTIFDAVDFDSEIARGAAVLSDGGVLVVPTETVYGAAGRLDHPAARARLRAIRGGTDIKPMTIHLARREDALQYIGPVNDLGRRLMRKLWPGPVGLIFEVPGDRRAEVAKKIGVDESDIYDADSIILRMPDHPVAAEIIGQITGPVVLTMASPTAGGANFKASTLADEL